MWPVCKENCSFRVHSNTDEFHLLHSHAECHMQHSILQQTWVSWSLCLINCSKSVYPVSPWQNWRPYVSHSPSQNLQEETWSFPILPLGFHRHLLTVQHPHFLSPIQFVRCALFVSVIARDQNQQKLDDKIDSCDLFLFGINYAFCQVKIDISLRTCWDFGTCSIKKCSNRTSPFVARKVNSCSLHSTIFRSNFVFVVEGMRFC